MLHWSYPSNVLIISILISFLFHFMNTFHLTVSLRKVEFRQFRFTRGKNMFSFKSLSNTRIIQTRKIYNYQPLALQFWLPDIYINWQALQLSLLVEWQCFPHLLQKLKSDRPGKIKVQLVVSPPALSDWESEIIKKDLWQAHCLWSGLVLLPSHVALLSPEVSGLNYLAVWTPHKCPSCEIFVLTISKWPLEPYSAAL